MLYRMSCACGSVFYTSQIVRYVQEAGRLGRTYGLGVVKDMVGGSLRMDTEQLRVE